MTEARIDDQTGHAPAPWALTGHGYLIGLRCTRAFGNVCAEAWPAFAGRALGGLGAVMVIDYATSNVGPYRELLISPGAFELDGRAVSAITHIWVSTNDSVVNGRANWGLPKTQARFDIERHDNGHDTFTVARGDEPALSLTLSARGPSMPVNTALIPRRWRTLEQPWQGRHFQTRIRAKGRTRLARLEACDVPVGSSFPDFTRQKHLFCLQANRFNLSFPPAAIRESEPARA